MLEQSLLERLQAIVGEKHARDDMEARVAHSYDGTPMLQSLPDGVVYPETTEQVSEIMKLLTKHRVPVVTRGSGSNLCGGRCLCRAASCWSCIA